MIALIKLELINKSVNVTLIFDELLWEVDKIIIKPKDDYEVLFLMIKMKLELS